MEYVSPDNLLDRDAMLQITREIGNNYALALFGIDRDDGKLCGCGTLVSIDESCYILTAAHVWAGLKKFSRIVTSLKERVDHRFLMRTDSIDASRTLKAVNGWGEWGPDLSLLRIPSYYLTTISAHKGFYNLCKERQLKGNCDKWVLLGAPYEKGTFSRHLAHFPIIGYFSIVDDRYERNGLDYLDLGVEVSMPDVPSTFGGVSGGGLWRVRYTKTNDGQINRQCLLEGVAFYETGVRAGRCVVRCHGMKTVASLIPQAQIYIPSAA